MRKLFLKRERNSVPERKSRQKKSDGGFTLVELLVAIVVLALVVVPTMTVFVTATKSNSKARTELQATITANSVLESAKAFSIYVFDVQCNTTYTSSNESQFTLIAGTASDSFVSSSYGGTVGTVEWDGDEVKAIFKRDAANPFQERADKYAYAINGIKQSNSTYDAIIVFEAQPYQDVDINGTTYTEADVNSEYGTYNKEYKISVYVYKHNGTSPEYIGKDFSGDDHGALVVINGSKIDSAIRP
ncbi:MAG: prepilin-type N-terminal cleavage/methylation domain-containing protein [Lachnospiraceae bacterium]